MSQEIYVVMGSTGEYSDRTEWPVCWYPDLASAEQHALNAGRRAMQIIAEKDRAGHETWSCDACRALRKANELDRECWMQNEFDPDMMYDYSGTRYEVLIVKRGMSS